MKKEKEEKVTSIDKIEEYLEKYKCLPEKKTYIPLRVTNLILLGPMGIIGEAFFGLGCRTSDWNTTLEAYLLMLEEEESEAEKTTPDENPSEDTK